MSMTGMSCGRVLSIGVFALGFGFLSVAVTRGEDDTPRRRPTSALQEDDETPAPRSKPSRKTEPSSQDESDEPIAPRRNRSSKSPASQNDDDGGVQPARRPQNPPRRGEQRPEPEPLQVEQLDPRLETILKDWETETGRIRKLSGTFTKFSYDHVFYVEKRSEGRFMYEAPDKGRYEVAGKKLDTAEKSQKLNKAGRPYRLQAGTSEKWYCTGADIYQIDEGQRTYDKIPIPEESRGKNIIDGPLPFLFGMKVDQAKRRYFLKLVKETDREVMIRVVPKLQHDLANYSEATLLLDRETWLPKAVRLFDPPRTKETVHTFSKMNTSILHWPFDDPFKPTLFGLKPIVHNRQFAEEGAPLGGPEGIQRSRLNLPGNGNSTRPPANNSTPKRTADDGLDQFPRRRTAPM